MNGGSWRWKAFWTMYVVLFVAYGIRIAIELLVPVLPYLLCGTVVCLVVWLYISWRRRYWDSY